MKRMTKKICFLMALAFGVSAFSTNSFAKVGDRIGYAKYTDIACCINHYPIEGCSEKTLA